MKSEKWELLADVFDGLGMLVEQNYDALFPDRDRAKQQAFKWLAEERYAMLLEEKKPTEKEYDHLARLLSGLTRTKPVLEAKFPEGSPFPSVLYKYAQQWERTCKPKPKVETLPPPQASPTQGTIDAPLAVPHPSTTGTTPMQTAGVTTAPSTTNNESMDTPRQAQLVARKAAFLMIEKESDRIMGYRLLRALRWDSLDKMPSVEGGKLRIEGPTAQHRAFFQKLLADKAWKQLIEKGESFFADGFNNLWLDLQRYISIACKELGAEYASLRSALHVETALLLKRLPELTSLAFTDGSTLCDDATKDWITAEVLPSLASGNGEGAGGGFADPLIEEQRAINMLVSANQIEDAVALVRKNMQSSSNERDLFRRTIIAGTLFIKAKQADIACSMLEALDRKIEEYNLSVWDPEIAGDAWAALATAYKAATAQKPQNIQTLLQEKVTIVLGKIALVNPEKAYSLSTK